MTDYLTGNSVVSSTMGHGMLAPEPLILTDRVSANTVPEGLSTTDWASIRAAYEAHRHQVVRSEDGAYRARNPEQGWRTEFDGRGFTTLPDAGGWQWGLDLKSYGFAGKKRAVQSGSEVGAEGDRVTYSRDASLLEWFVNDKRGLEHGFTLERAPAGEEPGKVLEFDFGVRGNLRPEISPEGMAVRFVDAQGGTALNYSQLKVWDANHKALPARFVAMADGVRFAIETDGARYPITVDPIAQQAYLKASNTDIDDRFGFSVAIFGNTVVIGAYAEDGNATGINGDQSDNSSFAAGAAYVFVRNGATWSQQAYLKASNTDAGDQFGSSVAISGDMAVVGAYREASSATGIDGDQSNNSAANAGAAYVFVRNGATWSQQAYLKASNTDPGDRFGLSVAVSGETVVVGAYQESSNASGINGNQSDNSAFAAGAAYVFVREGNTWSQQAYLKASNTDAGDNFGYSVAVSAETIVAGAFLEGSSATQINGDQSDNSAFGAGAAYVFVREGIIWSEQAYLKASNTDAGDQFGYSVAATTDTVLVGALGEDSGVTGINGDQSDNSAFNAGASYVFVRNGALWSQQAYLKASNTDAGDVFGWSVAASDDTVAVGAYVEDSNAAGINGDQSDNSATAAGAAYVFLREGVTWSQQVYLKASNADAEDFFGFSVAVSGDTVVVGAYQEAGSTTGINGDQSDNGANRAGAAYIFTGFGLSSPVVTSPSVATATVGQSFYFEIVATNSPTSYGATNLPAGLSLNTSSGIISGMPTAAGTKTVTVTATNAAGSGSAVLNLTVQAQGSTNGITIVNNGPETARTDQAFSFQLFATGISSGATFSAKGLPAGLVIDPQTGVISGTPAADGSFSVEVTVTEGGESATFTLQLTFTSDPGLPVITSPGSVALMAGEPFSYTISAPVTGVDPSDPAVYSIIGELPPGLTFDATTGTISGTYNPSFQKALKEPDAANASVPSKAVLGSVLLTATNSHGTATKPLVFLQAVPQLLNISTRMQVLTDDKVLIGGFIVTGTAPKKVIVRAIGPSLSAFGLAGALADPVLELHKPDMTVVTNDNWKESQQTEITAAGFAPSDAKEPAILATLEPGAYTAIVSGKNGGTGIGLVEVYDLDAAADSTLANISTRGFVDTGDNVMIGGVIVGGGTSQVLVRAIGPELTAFGVTGALEDTTLELHSANGDLITSNDDWKKTQKADIEATGLAPKDDRESAILMTLTPDSYTAIVRGKNDSTGVALVEVYNLAP